MGSHGIGAVILLAGFAGLKVPGLPDREKWLRSAMYHNLSSTASWYPGRQEEPEALFARDNSTSIRNGQTLVCEEARGGLRGRTGCISPHAVTAKFLAETLLL